MSTYQIKFGKPVPAFKEPRPVRKYSSRLLELIDEGVLDPDWVASTCVGFMSEQDVKEMVLSNDIQELF